MPGVLSRTPEILPVGIFKAQVSKEEILVA